MVKLERCIKNNNFYLKNHEDNFDEIYHLNSSFIIVFKIMLV
jgi:hypothetical protein